MDPTLIDRTLNLLTPEEGQDVLRFIDRCERNGTISPREADAWRRRIVATRTRPALQDS